MGDRGNIVIRQGKTTADDVWFYTHWSGSEIKQVVKSALAKNWRWTDGSYLARIVFEELINGNEGEETGFGISSQLGDNEYDILVVDVPRQVVFEVPESQLVKFRLPDSVDKFKTIPFSFFAVQEMQTEAE